MTSATRARLWEGFVDYLSEWMDLEELAGCQLLHAVWMAGSFISAKRDPSDIDITPVHDLGSDSVLSSKNLKSRLKRLIGHRQSVVKEFGVEPFPLGWTRIPSTLNPDRLSEVERSYLARRGAYDEWWQRVRPPGKERSPIAPDSWAARGYVEVSL